MLGNYTHYLVATRCACFRGSGQDGGHGSRKPSRKGDIFMKHKLFSRWVAILLVFAMCVSCLPVAVYAEEGEEETRSQIETEEQTLEDASAQLGEYTPPAADPEQGAEPPAEEPAAEPEAPAEHIETPAAATEAPAGTKPGEDSAAAPAPSVPIQGNMPNEGRDFADQQILKNVGGMDFILIGTRQQLIQGLDYYPAISSGTTDSIAEANRPVVMGPIWRVHYKRATAASPWRRIEEELVYPGDNNLCKNVAYVENGTNKTKDFSAYTLYGKYGKIMEGNGADHTLGETHVLDETSILHESLDEWRYVGGSLLEGPDEDVVGYDYGRYSQRNNYVVFRDIKLNEDNVTTPNWEPLMFYGLMYGVNGSELNNMTLAKAVEEIRASEDADYTYHADNKPTGFVKPKISNIYVVTSTENRMLDQNKYVGVGFFASVTSSRPGASNGLSHTKAEVRNIELVNVNITNNYEGIHVDETVLSGLLSLLGTGVGYLVDGLLQLLTGKNLTGFHDSLKDMLTARAKDKTNLATGSFVGRVYGDVLIENCDVSSAVVNSEKSYVGGFVGYSVGEEQYDALSNTLNSVLRLLTTVLNLVPGLGLGDLISVVQHLLPVNTLIPVDYYNPRFENCRLVDLSGSIGPSALNWTFVVEGLPDETAKAEFNGGFIGCKVATVMINCGIKDSDYTVYARNYGGGFAGLARDAVIQELLSDLGIQFDQVMKRLMDADVDLQSVQVRCYIRDSDITVIGENYLGGFNGAMTNAYCVNNEMKSPGKTLTVTGSGDYVGGFTGIATLGWAMSLGAAESAGTTSLLETVKNLVGSLAGTYGSDLINLSGAGQSEILGLQFHYTQASGQGGYVGGEASVTGHDYVGGVVGKADALILTGTTAASLQKTSYFAHGNLTIHDIFPQMDPESEFTITLYEYNTVTSDPEDDDYKVTDDDDHYFYTLPDPNNDPPTGYTFVGWITDHYDHSINKPDEIYAVGDQVLITHNTTFNALYAKEGDPVFELITRTPGNWEKDYASYVITYHVAEAQMMVLTGLEDDASYESTSNGGATSLADIRSGDSTAFEFLNSFQFSNVPPLYRFTANQVASTQDYYFKNVGKSTYLRRDLQGTTYRLEASSNNLLAGTQWHPSIAEQLNVLFENDLLSLLNNKDKIVYDNSNGYFRMGTTEEANTEEMKIYIWGETKLPTKYTTVAAGADFPENPTSVALDDSLIEEYAGVNVYGLRQVNGHKYVGGIAGLADTAYVTGLLNTTLGIGGFEQFDFNHINVVGGTVYTTDAVTGKALTGNDGLRVFGRVPDRESDTGAGYYVGGGIGMAVGGKLYNIELSWLNQVEGVNCVGGFVGCAGPGDLAGTGGLNVQLLGLSLLSANNLLSLGQGFVTDPQNVNVTGVSSGYTVEATGRNSAGGVTVYCAGGFFGRSNSTTANDCHANQLLWVKANKIDGRAGGFVGVSQVGGLASLNNPETNNVLNLVQAGNLANAVGYLIPTYTKVDAKYVDGGYVEAAWAGGFTADFQSGTVNNLSKDPLGQNQDPESKSNPDWYAVYNIDHVTGTLYAGGFGGKVYSGALADAGGGISILGDIDSLSINISDLTDVISAYVPKIEYAGVKSDRSTRTNKTSGFTGAYDETLAPSCQQGGFTVEVTRYDPDDKTTGAAGGFIGYASGAQVVYSNVTQLLHTAVTPPEELDGPVGASYYGNQSSYAVTGTRYAGGYMGYMDIGSSASLGGGLKALNAINANNILKALNSVISTVEHSDVYGGPGGFAVKADADLSTNNQALETEDLVTVYVIDETDSERFFAYIFKNGGADDGTGRPGHELSALGLDKNGHPYYSFVVDRVKFDRVVFSNNPSNGRSSNADADALKLNETSGSKIAVYNYSENGSWKTSVGTDIWPLTSAETLSGCDGAYTRYTGVFGSIEDIDSTVTNANAHSFGAWQPSEGVNSHYRVCQNADCDFHERRDCTLSADHTCHICHRTDAAYTSGDYVTVYVVDETNNSENSFYAYVFKDSSYDGYEWPGHKLTPLGHNQNNQPYYAITVDRAFYDRVMFNGTGGQQNSDSSCVHLDETTADVILVRNYEDSSDNDGEAWKTASITDIYVSQTTVPGCNGNYTHRVNYQGIIFDEDLTPPQDPANNQHSFGAWEPYAEQNWHYRVCTNENCGFTESEACQFENHVCSKCGREELGYSGAINEGNGLVGRSGGFVGWMRGSRVQDSHSWNFSYIIGRIAAGGYAGEVEPGSLADAIGDTDVLGGLAEISGSLLSVAQDFVPTIYNSVTTCIPCGGAVRADASSESGIQRGMAGGYVGHNCGGQIFGYSDEPWKGENDQIGNNNYHYNGPQSECAAIRILSVYGSEYAGGFTGLMDAGSTAGTGSISLLFNLVRLDNLLSALKVSYPMEENTAVYGPLYGVTQTQWNSWLEYVGQYGGYAMGMKPLKDLEKDGKTYAEMDDDEKLAAFEEMLEEYLYGFHVTAGRDIFENVALLAPAGCAGGYVGSMRSGTITNGQAYNVKQVKAMRNAGGFAGDMKTASAVNLGQASVLGLDLNLSELLPGAVQVFVPVVKTSSVHGYRSGLTVFASGDKNNAENNACGNAGGFAGNARGAQIWGDADDSDNPGDGCNVYNLKKVQGTRYVGGYIGLLGSGAVAEVGTGISGDSTPVQNLLNAIVSSSAGSVSSLVNLASATVSTVRYAEITVADPEWGFTVGGADVSRAVVNEGNTSVATVHETPLAAGGFIGSMEGAIVGNNKEKDDTDTNLYVRNLRGVEAQYYAGGFVGVAGSGSVLSATNNKATLLNLLKLGQVSVLDMFRPYIFNADVQGVAEGFTVRAFASEEQGVMSSKRYSGCAGGFAGAILNGTAENSVVTNLNSVKALNYGGGFIGFTGRSGVIDADDVTTTGSLSNLLNLQAGVGDIVGTTMNSNSVTGIDNGYTVEAGHYAEPAQGTSANQPIAGGFIGYGDLAQIESCSAEDLKYVKSDEVAGGFIGQTSYAHLVNAEVGGELTDLVVAIVNALVNKIINLDDLSELDVAKINVLSPVLVLDLLSDGDLVYVELLGLKIGVSFTDVKDGDNQVAVRIGDSSITLQLNNDEGEYSVAGGSNVTVELFRANHTNVKNSSVTGFGDKVGYDVFGGGAAQNAAAEAANGPAGGFVGLNSGSIFENCAVKSCDVIRGTAEQVGPFSGVTDDGASVYEDYQDAGLEGSGNNNQFQKTGINGTVTITYNPSNRFANLEENINLIRNNENKVEKIILMKDMEAMPNPDSVVPETADMQNPCVPTVDLTLSKVWEDLNGTVGARANGDLRVTFIVSQTSWTRDQSGNFVKGSTNENYRTVTLTKEDANEWTDNVWTEKLTDLPASGNNVWYTYSVREAGVTLGGEPVNMSDYISGTAYADSQTAPTVVFSGAKDSGYVAKINNTAVLNQQIVVDFGLPVKISVVDYLKAKMGLTDKNIAVVGVMAAEDVAKVSRYSTVYLKEGEEEEEDTEVEAMSTALAVVKDDVTNKPKPQAPVSGTPARYGQFELPTVAEGQINTQLRYVPGSMQMDQPVEIAAVMRCSDGSNYYTKVTVVPATLIYYEDDFITFSDDWEDVGSAQNAEQDEDRPGANVLDLDNVYGYDSRYSNGTTYSLNSAKKVTVTSGVKPTASFTFTGTGFDILAVTDKTTGFMVVEIYEGTKAEGNPKYRWSVDTFYGFSREEQGYIRYLFVWDETAETWRVAKTAFPNMTDAEAALKIDTTENGSKVMADYPEDTSTNHDSFILYKKNYIWTTNGTNNTLYQVPVLSSRENNANLTHGTYTVLLKPQYVAFFDHDTSEESYTLYIDGVRIYGPAEGLDATYYLQDHEGWPQFIEMRNLLINQGGYAPAGTNAGIVMIDGVTGSPTMSDFEQYGPNNEIYLGNGQSIAFRLKKGESAVVDQVHVSMKQVFGGDPCSVEFRSGVPGANTSRTTSISLNTASECYYDLSSVIRWEENSNTTELIVITNTSGSTLSLRNLKITYKQIVTNTAHLVSVAESTPNQTVEALNLLCRTVALPIVLDDDPVFMGASISLESDFSLHFYIPAAFLADKTNPYVLFTKQSEDGPFVVCQYDYVEEMVGETLCRRYSFQNLSAAEMGTEVTARLFYNADGVDHMSLVLPYSVRQYAVNMLEKTDDAALKTLMVNMLNYGAEAQMYFGVNESSLVNEGLTANQQSYATEAAPELENHKSLISCEGARAWFEGCSVSLERNVTLNYYLDLSGCGILVNELVMELSWLGADGTEHTGRIDGSAFTERQLGNRTLYVAVLDQLNAAQMRTIVSAALFSKEDHMQISDTMRYSIESYAHSKMRNDPALELLVLAMMRYGDAAASYFSNR